jgi:lysophospholipase L1-like esterase
MELHNLGGKVVSDTFRFDFGPEGEPASGYVKVTDKSVYHADVGYGFASTDQVTAKAREVGQGIERDFCIPFHSEFLVDVPDGYYRVSIVAGDAMLPTAMTLRAAKRQIFLYNRTTVPGQFIREMFTVYVQGGQLKLAFSGNAPRVNALEIVPVPKALKLFIAGDSTAADQESFPYAGWGQMLGMYLKHDVVVANHATSGRSSRSFIDEGRLAAIQAEIQKDDFLFIQFGHNDEKNDPERNTEPYTTYKQYLTQYIEAARSVGAHPVLLTSVQRRYFNEDGTLQDTHGDYLPAMRELAAEQGVPLIDMAEKTKALYESLGPERSKALFVIGERGEFVSHPDGVVDNTHFQDYGAVKVAGLVAEGIRELNLWPLTMYLR